MKKRKYNDHVIQIEKAFVADSSGLEMCEEGTFELEEKIFMSCQSF